MKNTAFQNTLCKWRHELHEHPEIAGEEVWTAAFVAEKLTNMGIDVASRIGGNGVVGTLNGTRAGMTIGLRADMDCLAMQELTGLPYKSKIANRMHACGHDGHMAMLLGAAKLLSDNNDFSGTVRFIFQPAEEPGKGAPAMVADGLFEKFPCDEVYGIHNAPYQPFGTIFTRIGGFQAAEDNFTIRIIGHGGHASRPQHSVDPLAVFSELYLAIQTIVSRNAIPTNAIVISCTEIENDGVHNAIPNYVVVRGDVRTYSSEDSAMVEDRMRTLAEHICEMNGAKCEFHYTREFLAVVNDKSCTLKATAAAKKYFGESNVNDNAPPCTGSEDFSAFTQLVPGCFMNLGTQTSEKNGFVLHTPTFDFNDDILIYGSEFWNTLVREILKENP